MMPGLQHNHTHTHTHTPLKHEMHRHAFSNLSCPISLQREKVVDEQVINRRLQQELLERETEQM